MTPVPRRHFTVGEANALLPQLERQLEQLQALYRRARAKFLELQRIRSVGHREDGTLIMQYDYRLARRDYQDLVERIHRILADIHGLGCEVKHIEEGLVDFPARIGDREVYLCWQLGEPAVAFYHGVHEGYAGRRPIPREAHYAPCEPADG